MWRPVVGLLAGLVITTSLRAQESQTIGAFELRPLVGAFVPTGAMRNDFAISLGFVYHMR